MNIKSKMLNRSLFQGKLIFKRFTTAVSKVGCKFGLHDREWDYVEDGKCDQIGKCKRDDCLKQYKRVFHDWSQWHYLAQKSCSQERLCLRCKIISQREQHNWGILKYERHDSCIEVMSCERCYAKSIGKENHRWGIWQYESENSCHQVSFCKRCHQKKDHEDKFTHNWREMKDHETGMTIKRCIHCGLKMGLEHNEP